MILQALNDYYDRRKVAGTELPEFGFEELTISFRIVLDSQGRLLTIDDLRELRDKKVFGKGIVLPVGCGRTVNVEAHPLWDNVEYVLGVPVKNDPARVKDKQCNRFYQRVHEVFGTENVDPAIWAILEFGKSLDDLKRQDRLTLPEGLDDKVWLTFWFEGDPYPIAHRPAVLDRWRGFIAGREANGVCLVTGASAFIPDTHLKIGGVSNANSTGAALVSFNKPAFLSYGKEQNQTAPVGEVAAFKYVTAINTLLAAKRQRVQVGDASTVFWAEKASGSEFEGCFLDFVDSVDSPDQGVTGVAALYNSVKSGNRFSSDDDQRFFVLGLSPNAARLAVRFWHVEPIAVLSRRFSRYFSELEIARHPNARPYFTLNQLLNSMALNAERSRLPQNLGGEILSSVIRGGRYPALMLNLALIRCRAEQSVTHPRAAILKAWVNRYFEREELKVELDENDVRPPYLLGRLFAVLERLQEEANPGIRSTIRNTYWSAASGAPLRVFPTLINLGTRHLQKLKRERPGRAVNFEKLIGTIVSKLSRETPFPTSFASTEQAVFIVGFYQQKQHPSTYKTQGDQE